MPEDIADTPDSGDDQQQPEARSYTTEQLNAVVEARLARERAKYSDYGDLKRKAGELDKLVKSQQSDTERAVAEARAAGAQEAAARYTAQMIGAEARALAAASKFRDATDAVAFLGDLSGIKIDDQGNVDSKTLQAALDDLAKRKPYLLAEEKPLRPQGDAGQGPREHNGAPNMNSLIHGLVTQGRS